MAEGFDPKPDYDIDYNENEDYPSEEQTKDENWKQTEDGFVNHQKMKRLLLIYLM